MPKRKSGRSLKCLIKEESKMPKLDGTGPDGKGAKTGRKLGLCSKASPGEKLEELGKGMGKKRKTGGGTGKGQRLNTDKKD